MVQLLVKDIRIQQRFLVIGFVVIGIFFFALGAFEGLSLAVPAAIFSHFLIVVASKTDEKNNNGRMLASFPLLRRDIVTAKYVGILVFMMIAFLITIGWRMLAGIVFPANELPWWDVPSTVAALVLLLVFYAIYFPIFFAADSRIVPFLDLIVIMTIGGIVLLGMRMLEWLGMTSYISLQPISDMPIGIVSTGAICGGLAMLSLSWGISLYIYEHKSL